MKLLNYLAVTIITFYGISFTLIGAVIGFLVQVPARGSALGYLIADDYIKSSYVKFKAYRKEENEEECGEGSN